MGGADFPIFGIFRHLRTILRLSSENRQDTTCRLTENGAGQAPQEGSGKELEQTSSACALCEDIRHFLSKPSITERSLCEETPKFLFGGSPAAGYAEKSFSMKMFGEHVRTKANLFLWHFEGKNQKMRVRRGRLFE